MNQQNAESKLEQAAILAIRSYIVTLNPKKQFNDKGKSLGMSDKLAIFYCPSIGRRRYYRQSMLNPQNGLKLLTFKTEKTAQRVCDIINEVSGIGWYVQKNNI